MLINWFTVIAQIVNFFVLVFLLKRFLYKPILKAIDERESKITSQLKVAEMKKTEAEKEKDDYEKKNKEFNQQKEERMSAVLAESKAERLRLLEDARKEYAALKSKLEIALQEEQEDINHEIAKLAYKEVYSLAEKMLKQLANSSLEESIIQVFIKQLGELKEEDAKQLKSSTKGGFLVKTAFDLSPSQQDEIKKEVLKIIHEENSFRFEVKPELISGIELTSGGFKLSWSIEQYLGSIQKSLDALIQRKSGDIKENTRNVVK